MSLLVSFIVIFIVLALTASVLMSIFGIDLFDN